MTIADRLNQLEKYYFFQRTTGEASASGYVDANTWRGFRSTPNTSGAGAQALQGAFHMLARSLERFLQQTANLTRQAFDAFHEKQVDELYDLLQTARAGMAVHPVAEGDFHGRAYNPYAKVVNLAHTHWCFRPQPNGLIQYPPQSFPELRRCLHVPLDVQVLDGVRELITGGSLPRFAIPRGGMGCVKSKQEYLDIQNYLRREADKIDSKTFRRGSKVSPLAFEGFWTAGGG
jgi:hypothetical protein